MTFRRSTRWLVVVSSAMTMAVAVLLASPLAADASTGIGYRILWVPVYAQVRGLDCEAAALQMALAHEGYRVGQNRILVESGIDWRPPVRDATGFHWGDPYTSFVGNPDGSEIRLTGYGEYAPVLAKAAYLSGGALLAVGEGISPGTIYWYVLHGHPAVAWVSFDFRWHQVTHYVAFDGRTVQFGSPYEHAVTVVGVWGNWVVINNPWGGRRQWIWRSTFEAAYATFNDMAVILR